MDPNPAHPANEHRVRRADLLNADGSPRYTNALARESSPYLLQHAHNPVDWHAWGEEAFDLARREGKPIFLSIGYSTCYWCHVMERQSFEEPETARLMNELFVNIKVDREERPDVDDIYMTAVQLMTGAGGWPMSVFLTPPGVPDAGGEADRGLKPIYAGTYFPPEPAHGRSSFSQVLRAVADAWTNRRSDALGQAEQVAQAVRQHVARREPAGELSVEIIQATGNELVSHYDADHGGFGSAPKFPTPNNLLLLQKIHANNPNAELALAIDHTLDRMARGGIFDQVGGGFHRYSTDAKWLVPHFEKMLYDNAQLVEAYLNASIPGAESPNRGDAGQYHRVVRMTCDYVLREMTDPTGAFWSAQDAEVDAREGGNYVWTREEVRRAVGDAKLTDLAVKLYGLDKGPNFRDPHDATAAPANVLYEPVGLAELAKAEKIELEELVRDQESINRRLLEARDARRQPATDDKVLVAWNGMMIAALARAGRDLAEPRYTAAAQEAARCILDRMRTEDGGLYRTMRGGRAKIPAFLEDYAFLIHGLVELHRTDGSGQWLDAGEALAELARVKFADESAGGYFDTLESQADLFVRTRSAYDGAVPSGNSQMVHALLDLHVATGRSDYLARAVADLFSFSGAMAKRGGAMAHMAHALLRAYEFSPSLSAGGEDAGEAEAAGLWPVTVDVAPRQVDLAGGATHLRVEMVISAGHHINAHVPGEESVVPTTLELLDAAGLEMKVKYPAAVERKYPLADGQLAVYEGRVEIEAVIRQTGPRKAGQRPRLVLTYQVCTEQSCLEPRSEELPVEFIGREA